MFFTTRFTRALVAVDQRLALGRLALLRQGGQGAQQQGGQDGRAEYNQCTLTQTGLRIMRHRISLSDCGCRERG